MANEIFTIIKNSSKLNSPIDYQKFLGFIAVLVKGSKLEKMILIFSIFGKGIPCQDDAINNNTNKYSSYDDDDSVGSGRQTEIDNVSDGDVTKEPRISREDMKMHISGTILSMVNVSF